MAAQVPAALKGADISRFALRAAQLEKFKPIISYWCEYWIVNQILGKGLHNTDQECLEYTTNLMDKLEKFKSENSTNEAVVDDAASKAYVQQFGLETFQRADNAVRANKASRQTADTFQATATFLDLLRIWGNIDPEVLAKTKYAKYHALRIVKALMAGEDPNLSNPKTEPEPEEQPLVETDDLDSLEANAGPSRPRQPSAVEVPDEADKIQPALAAKSSLDESLHPSRDTSAHRPPQAKPRQPSVVDVPDEADRLQSNLARQSSIDESLHPSRVPSVQPPPSHDVSPLAPPDPSSFYATSNNEPVSPIGSFEERKSSTGGNYFPKMPERIPSPISPEPPPPEPSLPEHDPPSAPTGPPLPQVPTSFDYQPLTQPHQPPSLPSQHHGRFIPSNVDTSNIPPNLAPQSGPRLPPPQVPPQLRGPPPIAPSSPQQYQHRPSPSTSPTQPQQKSPPPPVHRQQPPLTQYPPASTLPPPSSTATILTASSSPSKVVDEEAMMKAQKHARWAISALNFEDVPTAIRELTGALETLGVTLR